MNLQQIISGALEILNRSPEELEPYQSRFTSYANEAVLDLALSLKPWRKDALAIVHGQADTALLPCGCLKVLSAFVEGKRRLFYYGGPGKLSFPGIETGEAEIAYRYLPPELKELSQTPLLPEACHGLLPGYIAAREQSQLDAAAQNSARLGLGLYEGEKRKLKTLLPGPGDNRIENTY